MALLAFGAAAAAPGPAALRPVVEVEEVVFNPAPANNGAGPLWCYGSTCIVRVGDQVTVAGLETIPDAKPLNNVRWVLYRRGPTGWDVVLRDDKGRTREPSPLAAYPDGRVFLSVNPTLTPPDTYSGPAQPHVLEFTRSAARAPVALMPAWEGAPAFTEHSYRGMCADGPGRELLVMNVLGHEAQYWSFLDRKGRWSARGRMPFPMGADYEKPEPIRLCYPVLALKLRAAHVLAISDIVEPVAAWREHKRQVTGQQWDYEFRRLFYAWTPDLTREGFRKPVEIASREKTAGHITNLDLHVDARGRAHLLWLERSVWHPFMRDRFFPTTPLTTALNYAIVDQGVAVLRTTLAEGGEGLKGDTPGYARFHVGTGGRLAVVAHFTSAAGSENRAAAIGTDGLPEPWARLPLKHPFTMFMTATERGGTLPSRTLDLLGIASGVEGIAYARVRL